VRFVLSDELVPDGEGLALGRTSVVQREETWLGGEQRVHIPYQAVTSVGLAKKYSWPLVALGLVLLITAGSVWQVTESLEAAAGPAGMGLVVLAVAMVWTEEVVRIESPTETVDDDAEGFDAGPEALAEELLTRVE
jgi:hypothetical protein